eukprot:XP_001697586.1 predicted protein [Chlamydomonas reinhardtii]
MAGRKCNQGSWYQCLFAQICAALGKADGGDAAGPSTSSGRGSDTPRGVQVAIVSHIAGVLHSILMTEEGNQTPARSEVLDALRCSQLLEHLTGAILRLAATLPPDVRGSGDPKAALDRAIGAVEPCTAADVEADWACLSLAMQGASDVLWSLVPAPPLAAGAPPPSAGASSYSTYSLHCALDAGLLPALERALRNEQAWARQDGDITTLLEQGVDLAQAGAEGAAAPGAGAAAVEGRPGASSRRWYLRLNDALEAPESAPMQWPWLLAAGGTPPAGSAAAAQRDWLLSFAVQQWLPLLLSYVVTEIPGLVEGGRAPGRVAPLTIRQLELAVVVLRVAAEVLAPAALAEAALEEAGAEGASGVNTSVGQLLSVLPGQLLLPTSPDFAVTACTWPSFRARESIKCGSACGRGHISTTTAVSKPMEVKPAASPSASAAVPSRFIISAGGVPPAATSHGHCMGADSGASSASFSRRMAPIPGQCVGVRVPGSGEAAAPPQRLYAIASTPYASRRDSAYVDASLIEAAARLPGLWREVLVPGVCNHATGFHGPRVGELLRLQVPALPLAAGAPPPSAGASSYSTYSLRCALDAGLLPALERALRNEQAWAIGVPHVSDLSNGPGRASSTGPQPGVGNAFHMLREINALLEQGLDLAEDAASEGWAAMACAAREEATVSVAGAPAGSSGHSHRRRYLRLNDALEAPESAPMQWAWLVAAGGTPPAGSAAAAQRDWLLSFAALQWLPLLLEDLGATLDQIVELEERAADGKALVGYMATHTEEWVGGSSSISNDSTGDGTRCGGADNADADAVSGAGLEGCVLDALEAFWAHRPMAVVGLMLVVVDQDLWGLRPLREVAARHGRSELVQLMDAASADVAVALDMADAAVAGREASVGLPDVSFSQQVKQLQLRLRRRYGGAAEGGGGADGADYGATGRHLRRAWRLLSPYEHWREGGHATQCPGVVAATAAAGSAVACGIAWIRS